MSTLLDQAKNIAQQVRAQKDQDREIERSNQHHYQSQAMALREAVMAEVRALDGQPHRNGVFHLEERDREDVACYLFSHRGKDGINPHGEVLWVKSGVESGTWDASDDCRDLPYTTAYVTLRVYGPQGPKNHQWDTEERELYHNGGWTESATKLEDVPRLLKTLAERLAAWV